ncbi:LytTR family DNA-binding domain-containing protein [Chitinophagaceae bacterium LB-8]|uniref:LytTR family DNA-binding domain-containing protein n=1 Tax=Paraflavisolibacter caeni TaxID=2982496 RepID=A0A9X2XXC6_9BACT|nr:LytTR family DNA-binding domain-containing protein [Paraflavisolibacter caeni]MCU7549468.1 LytTR family DNA-binding domain-containing protein [Paraflavisolibacter caeni]
MKVLIVEDEILLAKQLKSLLQELEPELEIDGQTNSIDTTVQWLQQNEEPDLIFMDIELADGQCFDIFSQVIVKCPVIFTTAYDEYALRAFKVNSIDYLLKPINSQELKKALLKWRDLYIERKQPIVSLEALVKQLKGSVGSNYRERFLVKQGQKLVSINTTEVAYFFSRHALSFLVTRSNQKFVIDYTLDEVEQVISPNQFFRANRQFILAHDMITSVHNWFNGKLKLEIRLPLEEDIIVSREKASIFKEWMGA